MMISRENTVDQTFTINPTEIQEALPQLLAGMSVADPPWEFASDAEIEWVSGLWQGTRGL